MKPISNAPKDPIARQEVQEASNPEFTEASTRENIQSEEPLSTLFGKIKKFFTDLKTVAFSGSYNDLSDTPSLGTAAAKDVANSGDASTSQVVMGNDSRLTDARTPTSHTHSYAGSSSAGGAATSAEKLTNTSKVGDTNKPVYFTANGVPAAISYTIDKSVPSDAVFTDHYAWGDITGKPSSYTPASHTHGNIQNGGTLQTNDITIASGDKIVVTDSSDSSKIARTSISFDGSTTTQCLTKKGTWATFGTSNLTIGTSSSTAAAGNHTHNYAGSSSAGGVATSAAKLSNTSKIGDTNKPVYFKADGTPAAISYTIDKSAPSNAVFTDHYAWSDITGKPSTYTPSSHTHNYAGSSSAGGTANSAVYCTDQDFARWSGAKRFGQTNTNGNYSYNNGGFGVKNAADNAFATIYASNISSSLKFKENVQTMTDEEAEKLLNVRVVTYDYKRGVGIAEGADAYNQRGVIAEEVNKIIPYVVIKRELGTDGSILEPYGVEYHKFVPYLIKMIQIQDKRITELENQLKS